MIIGPLGKESDIFAWPQAALATGWCTVRNMLWTVRSITEGHFSKDHRAVSCAPVNKRMSQRRRVLIR